MSVDGQVIYLFYYAYFETRKRCHLCRVSQVCDDCDNYLFLVVVSI